MSSIHSIVGRLTCGKGRRGPWRHYESRIGKVSRSLRQCEPDFLVISAPQTGGPWLRENLVRHDEIFIPQDEQDYFCTFWRWRDVNAYLGEFAALPHKRKGDVGASYAILPPFAIRTIRRLLGECRLVFLMREPQARAWAHIRHDYRYRLGAFSSCGGEEAISLAHLTESGWMDYYLSFSDYAAVLERWLQCFRPSSFCIDFTERSVESPQDVLTDVFRHLDVRTDVDFTFFPLHQRVLTGDQMEMPSDIGDFLRRSLTKPVSYLDDLLRRHFSLGVPAKWGWQVEPAAGRPSEQDDHDLTALLDRQFKHSHMPRLIEQQYLGFNIVMHRGRAHAISCGGAVDLQSAPAGELRRLLTLGQYLVADSPRELKALIHQQARYACMDQVGRSA